LLLPTWGRDEALFFDGSAWCISARRLEQGGFQTPAVQPVQAQITIDAATLAIIRKAST
jgi:hypothetical protein